MNKIYKKKQLTNRTSPLTFEAVQNLLFKFLFDLFLRLLSHVLIITPAVRLKLFIHLFGKYN